MDVIYIGLIRFPCWILHHPFSSFVGRDFSSDPRLKYVIFLTFFYSCGDLATSPRRFSFRQGLGPVLLGGR